MNEEQGLMIIVHTVDGINHRTATHSVDNCTTQHH